MYVVTILNKRLRIENTMLFWKAWDVYTFLEGVNDEKLESNIALNKISTELLRGEWETTNDCLMFISNNHIYQVTYR